jgi:transposase
VSTVELVVPRCAGLDVAKDEVVACVRVPDGRGGRRQEVRTYPTFTSGLEALAAWLAAEQVTQVVMEATGQYWKPVWYVLEERGFQLLLVNARHVKILPGRKTTWPMQPGWRSCWSMGCCAAASCRHQPSGSCGT